MKQLLIVAIAFALLPTGASRAAIVNSMSFNSTTGLPGITSWPSPYTDTSRANPSQYTVTENNYGGASLFSLAQSFTASVTGKLTSIEMAITGTAPVSFNVSLFDAGTNDATDIGSGTYTPGSNGYSNNLFSDTSLQTWNGFTVQGASAGVLNFALSGADQVSVVAGQTYIFEVSATTNPNGMIWFRNGDNTIQYPGGQAFRQRSPLNGNAARDFTIAANIVEIPEPASLILLGCSLMGSLLIRKR
jgi:hypothetical protein